MEREVICSFENLGIAIICSMKKYKWVPKNMLNDHTVNKEDKEYRIIWIEEDAIGIRRMVPGYKIYSFGTSLIIISSS